MSASKYSRGVYANALELISSNKISCEETIFHGSSHTLGIIYLVCRTSYISRDSLQWVNCFNLWYRMLVNIVQIDYYILQVIKYMIQCVIVKHCMKPTKVF